MVVAKQIFNLYKETTDLPLGKLFYLAYVGKKLLIYDINVSFRNEEETIEKIEEILQLPNFCSFCDDTTKMRLIYNSGKPKEDITLESKPMSI
jgi:hypothetical protein